MNTTKNLNKAKLKKMDEFYTLLPDIEKELIHYTVHFKGKVVFCNCDDPLESNFWKYFATNFKLLGLKKLVSTHYSEDESTYKLEITSQERLPVLTPIEGNGDFRSQECIDILKDADVVVTNPPFSLFREYVAQLIEHNKQFIIIGNMNSISYKDVFALIKENKIWLGANPMYTITYRVPPTQGNEMEYKQFRNTRWYTNIDHKRKPEQLNLYRTYKGNESTYPKYDNYDAIEVSKTVNIPMDYFGAMGVPISFLDKYNPEQFEIVGNEYDLNIEKGRCYINQKRMYSRIIIKNRKVQPPTSLFQQKTLLT